jgi:hypothetical protein
MVTLTFSFTTTGANMKITLVRLNDSVTIAKLDTNILRTLPASDHASVLKWIRDTTAAVMMAPSIEHHYPCVDNHQEYAHLVAWTSPNEAKFKHYTSRLKYDNDLLLEFARKHDLTHIIAMLQPRTHTITMHNLAYNDKLYSIYVTLTKVIGEITAAYSVQGTLTADDLGHATTAINIMKDIIDGCNTCQRIEGLRRATTFDETAFVFVAKLAKNPYVPAINASVRPDGVNAYILATLPW